MVHYHGAFDPQCLLPAVKHSIVVNRTIRDGLFSILGPGCLIVLYATLVAFADRKFEIMGRDVDWRYISNNKQHMGLTCIHFGGGPITILPRVSILSRAAPFQQTDLSIKTLACLSVSQVKRFITKEDEYLLRHEPSEKLFRIIYLSIQSG